MTDFLVSIFTKIIEAGGYAGLVFLMGLESMIAPVPSEAVMPFAGFLWFQGKMTFWLVIFFSTLGSAVGSLISYYLGLYGGRPVIKKFGKYLLLNESHLVAAESFFKKFGTKAIFISRFIPVIRHLISLPAGAGRMNLGKFIIYTVFGAGIWNGFLAYLGYYLGSNWTQIKKYGEMIDLVLIAAIIILLVLWLYKKYQHNRNNYAKKSQS